MYYNEGHRIYSSALLVNDNLHWMHLWGGLEIILDMFAALISLYCKHVCKEAEMPKDVINKMRKDIEATHKNRDGIPQIAGGLFLIIAMAQLATRHTAIFVAFVGFIPMIIEGMRRRITYPRIGYAKFPEPTKLRLISSILVALVMALLIIGFLVLKVNEGSPFPVGWIRTAVLVTIGITMMIIAAVLLMTRRQFELVWEMGIFLALLILIAFDLLNRDNLVYLAFGLGLLSLVIGMIRLYRFIRKYPVIKDE